jgi:hypothetical protein
MRAQVLWGTQFSLVDAMQRHGVAASPTQVCRTRANPSFPMKYRA